MHYKAPDVDSLDPADRLNASDPGVRTTPLPKVRPSKDGWRLLDDDDLTTTFDGHRWLDTVEVACETQKLRLVRMPDGADELKSVWPRAAFNPFRGWEEFEIGDSLDVKDIVGTWIECVILGIRSDAIYVHYKGWKSSWDAWVLIGTDRLASLQSHTSSSMASSSSTSYSYSSYSYNSSEEGKPEASGAVGLRNLGNTCQKREGGRTKMEERSE